MIKRLIGLVALCFAVTAASACPGDQTSNDGKGARDGKLPGSALIGN